ncbi:MAG TPA: M17 family peptidase N-terminal domain-containing protein, partial [Candidatus Binatia bacterium]|nr:M17 family peptidase N-terminal domain-containing protein [Candidatus Binatia bacterium]
MEIRFRDASAERIRTGLLVIPVSEKALETSEIRALNRVLNGNLRARMQKSKFTGAEGSTLLYTSAGFLPAAQILLVGMGSESDLGADTWRKTGARARREAAAVGADDVAFFFAPARETESAAAAVVEGAQLAAYQFNKYRSNAKPPAEIKSLTLFKAGLKQTASLQKAVDAAQAVI